MGFIKIDNFRVNLDKLANIQLAEDYYSKEWKIVFLSLEDIIVFKTFPDKESAENWLNEFDKQFSVKEIIIEEDPYYEPSEHNGSEHELVQELIQNVNISDLSDNLPPF